MSMELHLAIVILVVEFDLRYRNIWKSLILLVEDNRSFDILKIKWILTSIGLVAVTCLARHFWMTDAALTMCVLTNVVPFDHDGNTNVFMGWLGYLCF